jgi:hypothetical protein
VIGELADNARLTQSGEESGRTVEVRHLQVRRADAGWVVRV